MARRPLIITTQPGWAFATLSEIRAVSGEEGYVGFHHRDSTLVCNDGFPSVLQDLRTPAEVFGEVVSTSSRRGEDATRRLDPAHATGRCEARRSRPASRREGNSFLDVTALHVKRLGAPTVRRQDLLHRRLSRSFKRHFQDGGGRANRRCVSIVRVIPTTPSWACSCIPMSEMTIQDGRVH